jgi:hypothetical protein
MGLKGYRLWVMGQLDSTCRAPTRCILYPVDPYLVSVWFQPLDLKCDFVVAKFAFEFYVYRYGTAGELTSAVEAVKRENIGLKSKLARAADDVGRLREKLVAAEVGRCTLESS